MQKNTSKNIFTERESGLERVQTQSAFTLVELIVVITIVGILSTIGFVAYSGYLGGARDGNRIASLTKLSDSLQTYAASKSLPLPDDAINIEASGSLIAYQGYVGENVLETIDFTNGGKDPKDDSYYTYYLTKDRKKLQLLTFLEEQTASNIFSQEYFSLNTPHPNLLLKEKEQAANQKQNGASSSPLGEEWRGGLTKRIGINQTYAADYSTRYPKTYGQKLGVLISSESATKNIPAQEISANITSGKVDVVTTSANYTAIMDEQKSITGTGMELKSLQTLANANWKIFDSCRALLNSNSNLQNKNGNYTIMTSKGKILEVYCDMTTDGGGYTLYPIDAGIQTYASTDNDSCKNLGMNIFIPRTKAHFQAVVQKYGTSYFSTIPGITKPTSGGSYVTVAMNSVTAPDWKALDGGKWWIRDTAYSEPNGDYTQNCWLYVRDITNIQDITFNDQYCSYSTTKYICSTNDK